MRVQKINACIPSFVIALIMSANSSAAHGQTSTTGSASLASSLSQTHIKCPGKNTLTINRPTGEGNRTFPYQFEMNCKDPSLPTVIHIPGGPGMPSIGSNPLSDINANVISTDARGTGVNATYWVAGGKEEALSTEKVADDIVAIVENLKLKNYSIHGSSFGTAVATVAASKLERDHAGYLPKAVILEGVIGRAEQDGEQSAATQKIFDELKTEAGYCLTCKLDSLQGPLSSTEIGNLMDALQSAGKDVAANFLEHAPNEKLIEMGKSLDNRFGPNENRFYNAIACREYFTKGQTDTPYANGQLESPVGGSCQGSKRDHPFDSKNWQVKSKIFYMVGTADNFTPPSQARYHFENQKSTNKEVICIPRGGHTPSKYNIPKCSTQVFSKMTAGLDVVPSDLSSCRASVQTNSFSCEE